MKRKLHQSLLLFMFALSAALAQNTAAPAASPKTKRHRGALDHAEQALVNGDVSGAQKIAERVINQQIENEDYGRAAFILARAATKLGKTDEARLHFEYSVLLAHDPRQLAWSHIYLGRMSDLQGDRTEGIRHYRAALEAGDPTPDTKVAAEKGLAAPFQLPLAPAK